MPTTNYKVLWLDDDIDVIGIMTRLLEREAEVEKVSTCLDAVGRLDSQTYDAILLDWILPTDAWTRQHGAEHIYGYYGKDILRLIRREGSRNRTTPVVLYSVLGERQLSPLLVQDSKLSVSGIIQKASAPPSKLRDLVMGAIADRKPHTTPYEIK